ncbi:hypothetical protein FRB96_006585 [Tulasnella sp. 330]|nr:hypothetical protein FRB96_006585 [Tulasnella sp. 330]
MNNLCDSDSSDVLAALVGISSLPSHLLEPYDNPNDYVGSSPGIYCRVGFDGETNNRTTVWISKSHNRLCQNITIFDGWRICVQVPTADWANRTYTTEDVRRAALLCMGRQYLSESSGEGFGCCFINVKEGADAAAMDPDAVKPARRDVFVIPSSPPPTVSTRSSVPTLSLQIPSHPPAGTSSAHTAENGHETPQADLPSSTLVSPYSAAAPHPSSPFARPPAPEPFTPVLTVEHGHEPPEGQMTVDIVAPKPISSFFLVSRSDIALRPPPQTSHSKRWWCCVVRIPAVPRLRGLSIRRRARCAVAKVF